jgi:Zn-finger nucleic acid-binding protein
VKIDPQAIHALAEGTVCPRCKSDLRRRALGTTQVIECSACGGIWLSAEAFVRLCEQAEAERADDDSIPAARPTPAALEPGTVHYLPCPVCGRLMGRKNYGRSSGVIIDTCVGHGVWLDDHELSKILAFVRGGGLERERKREVERACEEQRRDVAAIQRAQSMWTSRLRGSPRGVPAELLVDGILKAIDLVF